MKKSSVLLLAVMLVLTLVLAACGEKKDSDGQKPAADKAIKLAYVAWDSEIASTNVVREILESKLNYKVEMLQVDAGPMYTGLANASVDAMVAAWLPGTHGELYYEPNKDNFEDLGPNMVGTRVGLVVPTYMDITSIEDLLDEEVAKSLNMTITGIEPGAGIMNATEEAVVEYGLDKWNVLVSSSAGMTKELQTAYNGQKPIVVTGWTPHWKFAEMDLKYLEDPKGVYGGDESIHTLVRLGLKEDHPEAYQFLDQFEWAPSDMEEIMVDIFNGTDEKEAVKKWIDANEEKVNVWLEGIDLK